MKEKISLKEFMVLLVGMFFVSAAIYYIMMPSEFVVGSLSGLVIVLTNFIPLKVSTLTFILNSLLFILGFLLIGKEFGGKTVITSLILPVYLAIFEVVTPEPQELTNNILVNLLCFVICLSFGQTMLFNINASSGGLDIVAKILNKYMHIEIGRSLMIAGFVIAASSIFVYDRNTLVISVLGTYIDGVVLDQFLDGSHIRKKISIISPQYDEIREFIVKKLNRGVTLYNAVGGWDNSEKIELVTILQNNEYASLLEFVNNTDPSAFITVSTVGQVIGQWNPHRKRTD